MNATELIRANALNDTGCSSATGFRLLPHHFDKTVQFYERAIQVREFDWFDNLLHTTKRE